MTRSLRSRGIYNLPPTSTIKPDSHPDYQFTITSFDQTTFSDLHHLLKDRRTKSISLKFTPPFEILEQLFKLGFKSDHNDDILFSYFSGGTVYLKEALGKFYIGSTTRPIETYLGSGVAWLSFIEENNLIDEDIKTTILGTDFLNERQMHECELKHLQLFFTDDGLTILPEYADSCLNERCAIQGSSTDICPECGGRSGQHRGTCSLSDTRPCPECGGTYGKHRLYCSQHQDQGSCPHCGYPVQSRKHSPSCPDYVAPKSSDIICPECGGKAGQHKKTCPDYIEPKPCPECGAIKSHLSSCSRYDRKQCPECGADNGTHLDTCSHSQGSCPYCGYSLQSKHHELWCPLCTKPEATEVSHVCIFCKGLNGDHERWCVESDDPTVRCVCVECKGTNERHPRRGSIVCSHSGDSCQICEGSKGHHKSWCCS